MKLSAGSSWRCSVMPRFAYEAFSLSPSRTLGARSPGRSTRSISPRSNDSSRGCASSMIEISTRGTSGSLRPASPFAIAASAGGRRRRIARIAPERIRLEHDLLRAPPLGEPVRPGADRVLGDAVRRVLVLVDDLARDGREGDRREPVAEAVVRLGEAHADRVAVERHQPLDRRVVVEARRSRAPSRSPRRRRRAGSRTRGRSTSGPSGRAAASSCRRSPARSARAACRRTRGRRRSAGPSSGGSCRS